LALGLEAEEAGGEGAVAAGRGEECALFRGDERAVWELEETVTDGPFALP
jgi:hypothetical protein